MTHNTRTTIDTEILTNIANDIKHHCSQFLHSIQGRVAGKKIYHGIKVMKEPIFSEYQIPANRVSKNIPFDLHVRADKWFFNQFSVRYRSNAVFGNGKKAIAAKYSYHQLTPVLLPINTESINYSFCWSSQIEDLATVLNHQLNDENELEDVDLFLDESSYQEGNMQMAIASGNEIMLYAPAGYYLLDVAQADLLFIQDLILR